MAKTLIRTAQGTDIVFDAVIKAEHNVEVEATEHPIESGASVTDHSFVKPETVTMEIAMSDAMSDEARHSENMFDTLRDLIFARETVTVVTRFKTYTDMLVVALRVPDETVAMFGLRAEIKLQHLEIVSSRLVRVYQKVSSGKAKPKEEVQEEKVEDLDNSGDTVINQALDLIDTVADALSRDEGGNSLWSFTVEHDYVEDIEDTFPNYMADQIYDDNWEDSQHSDLENLWHGFTTPVLWGTEQLAKGASWVADKLDVIHWFF